MRVEVKAAAFTQFDVDLRIDADMQRLIPKSTAKFRVLAGVVLETETFAFEPGENVVCCLPPDYAVDLEEESDHFFAALGDDYTCNLQAVKKPADITFDQAVAALALGLRPVVAVHSVVEALPGETVLVVNDSAAAKVALAQGCEVFCLGSSDDPRIKSYGVDELPDTLLRDTAGFGVKHILDFSRSQTVSHKSVMLQCLGFQGKWAIIDPRFQLDPPESTQLCMRSASVHFVFPEAWLFHGSAYGKMLLMMQLVLDKFRSGELVARPRKLSSLKAFTADEEGFYKN